MHAVIETPSYLAAAAEAGLSLVELEKIALMIARDPEAGDVIEGTGGCRKVRIAGRGKGKSGGYRLVTFYSGESLPAFLITVFSKGERSNLSKAERNDLAKLASVLVESLGKRTTPVRRLR